VESLRLARPGPGTVEIENSPLSEVAALGFEYGYSLEYPEALVAWEAQFGDFVNAAQVIVDQFIVSAEQKWHRLSGIVLLLPHGFEGMGPEHSSARLERFLALGVDNNIQVANPTTPAQYFHLLRRQVLRRWRKPLIVMTPKSLLRHPQAVSTLDECASGGFRSVIADGAARGEKCARVLLCSGKIYYDLAKRREDENRDDVEIVRVEELYPTPAEEIGSALGSAPDGTPAVWVPGGAGEHGRVAPSPALLRRDALRTLAALRRQPRPFREPGHGLGVEPPPRAAGARPPAPSRSEASPDRRLRQRGSPSSDVRLEPRVVSDLVRAVAQPGLVLDAARDAVEAAHLPLLVRVVHDVVDRDPEKLEDRHERPARDDELGRRGERSERNGRFGKGAVGHGSTPAGESG
jgi:hypothetical protein